MKNKNVLLVVGLLTSMVFTSARADQLFGEDRLLAYSKIIKSPELEVEFKNDGNLMLVNIGNDPMQTDLPRMGTSFDLTFRVVYVDDRKGYAWEDNSCKQTVVYLPEAKKIDFKNTKQKIEACRAKLRDEAHQYYKDHQ